MASSSSSSSSSDEKKVGEGNDAAVVESVPLADVIAGCKTAIQQLKVALHSNGWSFVTVPSLLMKQAQLVANQSQPILDRDTDKLASDAELANFRYPPRYGYVEVPGKKRAIRALTGSLVNEMKWPYQLHNPVAELSHNLDTISKQLVDVAGEELFHTDAKRLAEHRVPLFIQTPTTSTAHSSDYYFLYSNFPFFPRYRTFCLLATCWLGRPTFCWIWYVGYCSLRTLSNSVLMYLSFAHYSLCRNHLIICVFLFCSFTYSIAIAICAICIRIR